MNRFYLVAIPAIITIVALSYMLYPHQTQDAKVTPQTLMQNGSPVLGNPDATITIVEWGDYQCTYCHAFHETSKDSLIKEYVDTGKVNFVFRDFPLNGPDSVLAAEASYCASDQNKYWEYHGELYKNWAGEKTGWVNRKSLDQFANTVGIDTTQFDKCLNDKKYEQKVLDNQKFGEKIGINATPSFLIFDNKKITKIEGAQPFSVFKQVLDSF
ncbi:MAG: DsbA family protein [Thaumarchaeota archaeon]|nr:DsbA family protein [Nitrososphaerota archaeon]MBI3639212.1 DsbA family protein [Nitrososphaerota archaeon]